MATRKTAATETHEQLAARVEREHWLPPGPKQLLSGPFRAEERLAGGQWSREREIRGKEYLQLLQSERAARTPPAALRQTESLARDAYWRDKSRESARDATREQERQHGR